MADRADWHRPHLNLEDARPVTPRKDDINSYLKQLSKEHDLELPWNDTESPSRRRKSPAHDVAREISFLYFQDRVALKTAIEEFRRWLPFGNAEDKLTYLLERLTIARTSCLKRRTPANRSVRGSPERQSTRSANLLEPLSPTLSIKHAPKSSIEMPADDFRLPPARTTRKSSLKRPRSREAFQDKRKDSASGQRQPHYPDKPDALRNLQSTEGDPAYDPFTSSGDLPPPPKRTASAQNAGPTSVNTSFTSAGGLTSAITSFWSNPTQGTEDPGSPATSVGEEFHTLDGKGAEFGSDGANDSANMQDTDDFGDLPSQCYREARQVSAGNAASKAPPSGLSSARNERQYVSPAKPENVQSSQYDCDESYFPQHQLPSPADSTCTPKPHDFTGPARIAQMSKDRLSSLEPPPTFVELPFHVLWDAMRVLQTERITATKLAEAWQSPRDQDSLLDIVRSRGIPFEASDKAPLNELACTANWRWVKSARGRLFDVQLLPLRKQKSNILERRFDRRRFFTLNAPSFLTPHRDTALKKDKGRSILLQVQDLLNSDQHLLGRIWRRIHIQSRDSRPHDPDFSESGGTQICFFAERSVRPGDPLSYVKHEYVVNWWMQFHSNGNTGTCKAYTRLDLGVSKTTPIEPIEEDGIEYGVNDIEPTDDPDDTRFDDPDLPRPVLKIALDEVMNDGCNLVDISVMRKVQEEFGLPYLPSVVQARFAGAKGVWILRMVEGDDDDDDAVVSFCAPKRKVITVGKSQVKLWQNLGSFDDPEKRTLNVNSYNRPPEPAILYLSFLPILADRNVPWDAIGDVANEGIGQMMNQFLEALHDREKLQHWMESSIRARAMTYAVESIEQSHGFPSSAEDQITKMSDSLFEPTTCKHLAKKVQQVGELHCKNFRQQPKIPLAKSTMLYGICDMTGKLDPNTIHVGFLNGFFDGERQLTSLKGRHALVGRLPALGPSDMQKVRCVYHPALAHLTDVVVFPAKGPRSLASKLQGGDYDGDQFVIIWDQRLVKPFLNAPVQAIANAPAKFGIKRDTRRLKDVVPTDKRGQFRDEDVAKWLAEGTAARLRRDYVGMVTTAYDTVVYHKGKGGLHSTAATELRELHDYLLDAPKQGFVFDDGAWNALSSKHRLNNVKMPAYKRYLKGEEPDQLEAKEDNIIDYVLFRKVEPVLQDALKRAEAVVTKASNKDDQLRAFFLQKRRLYERGSVGREELENLLEKIAALKASWEIWRKEYKNDRDNKTRTWRAVVDKARQAFESIMPDDPDSEPAKTWLIPAGYAPTQWDLFKASALCASDAAPALMFEAAGRELCHLKVYAVRGAQTVGADVMSRLKLRPLKRRAEEDVGVEEDEGMKDKKELGQGLDGRIER